MKTNVPSFQIGNQNLSLQDLQCGAVAFGGFGTGKTVSFVLPLIRQCFRFLNDPNPESNFAKCGALIVDTHGHLTQSIITELHLAKRDLSDLLILDPQYSTYQYNPIDSELTAAQNADKLTAAISITDHAYFTHNPYWIPQLNQILRASLLVLELQTPKHLLTLKSISTFLETEENTLGTVAAARETLTQKRKHNHIDQDSYNAYDEALHAIHNLWITLTPQVTAGIKAIILNIAGPILSNPGLTNTFCAPTNIDFAKIINDGQILVFQAPDIDTQTQRFIARCLKSDFHRWLRKRNGSVAHELKLNTTRSILYVADNFHETITSGTEGDSGFLATTRSTRTIPILTTESISSLHNALGNTDSANTLIKNIGTHVFLKTYDVPTQNLVANLSQPHPKRWDTPHTQITDGKIVNVPLSQLPGPTGLSKFLSKLFQTSTIDYSIVQSDNFAVEPEDLADLKIITAEKSKSGPFYSEAYIYSYSTEVDSARISKADLLHLYYGHDIMTLGNR